MKRAVSDRTSVLGPLLTDTPGLAQAQQHGDDADHEDDELSQRSINPERKHGRSIVRDEVKFYQDVRKPPNRTKPAGRLMQRTGRLVSS